MQHNLVRAVIISIASVLIILTIALFMFIDKDTGTIKVPDMTNAGTSKLASKTLKAIDISEQRYMLKDDRYTKFLLSVGDSDAITIIVPPKYTVTDSQSDCINIEHNDYKVTFNILTVEESMEHSLSLEEAFYNTVTADKDYTDEEKADIAESVASLFSTESVPVKTVLTGKQELSVTCNYIKLNVSLLKEGQPDLILPYACFDTVLNNSVFRTTIALEDERYTELLNQLYATDTKLSDSEYQRIEKTAMEDINAEATYLYKYLLYGDFSTLE